MNPLYRCRMFVSGRLQTSGRRFVQGLLGLLSSPQVQRIRHVLSRRDNRRLLLACLVYLLIRMVAGQLDLWTILDLIAIHRIAMSYVEP